MTRSRMFLAVACSMILAACANPPSNPVAPASATSSSAEAKPGSGSPHTATFTGHLVGSGNVSGSITGAFSSANLKASAGGSYTLTVTTVDRGNEQFCTDADLETVRAALGSASNVVDARSGTLSVSVTQNAADGRASLIWGLSGMTGSDGRTWSTSGNSTTNGQAYIDANNTTDSLSVTQTNGVIGFGRYVGGTRKKDFSTACRATFTLTMAKQ